MYADKTIKPSLPIDYARRHAVAAPATQYELSGITQEMHGEVPVAVPPLWHAVVTARLTIQPDAAAMRRAQERLEHALAEIESVFPLEPAGIYIQVAYGLPYFRRFISKPVADKHLPHAIEDGRPGRWAVIDSIRYDKDPAELILEGNEVCFHFKSDYRANISETISSLFYPGVHELNGIPAEAAYVGDLFTVTSIRRGFVGRNMPRATALRYRIPAAERIPFGAELFMGFTSSHVAGLAQGNLPSFETLPGYTDATPQSYFAAGTAMHLSHIALDLEAWYRFGYQDRLHRMFNPRRSEPEGNLSPSQAPDTATFAAELETDAASHGLIGHNEQMQHLSRVNAEITTAYGQKVPRGTTIFLRQDFDTIENPFEFWLDSAVDPVPLPSVHFVGMANSSQLFELVRKEMDSVELQRKYKLGDDNIGFTRFLTTTHRQNFLLPPRAHRSFPLAEL